MIYTQDQPQFRDNRNLGEARQQSMAQIVAANTA
jgi:hypothetical protein